MLIVSGIALYLVAIFMANLLAIENSLTVNLLILSSMLLGIEIFTIAFEYGRKETDVDMKYVRRQILKEIKTEELESIDQTFELATLLIGVIFASLYLVLPQSFHSYSLVIELMIIGTFYITYKIARIKLAIDLRLRIISVGIGTFSMLGIFAVIFLPLWYISPILFIQENILNTIFFSALFSYIIGRQLYAKRIVGFFNQSIEKVISTNEYNEKERLKEQLLYLVENETVPVMIPLAIGVFAISPWILLPFIEIMGSIGVLFLVVVILPMHISITGNQYRVFVYPIGPIEGIEEGPWIPKRRVQEDQLEIISISVYDMLFGNDKTLEFDNEVYTVSETRNKLKSVQIGDLFFMEQNQQKFSEEAVQARKGRKIMWVFRLRKILAIVNDGKFTNLQESKYIPMFAPITTQVSSA